VAQTNTATPVVVVKTVDPRTATVSALLTQAANAQKTTTARATSTALPTTGFADQVGLPGLFGATIALLAVVFLARRLRLNSGR
jgi:LPXTG-motif cell wall-anchored protein